MNNIKTFRGVKMVRKPTKEEIEENKTKEETKKSEPAWEVVFVPTQHEPAIKNTESEEALDLYHAVALVLNKLEDIESVVS